MVSHLPAWPFQPESSALGCVAVIGPGIGIGIVIVIGVAVERPAPRVDEPPLSGGCPLAPCGGVNLQLEQGAVRVLVPPPPQVVIHWRIRLQAWDSHRRQERVD